MVSPYTRPEHRAAERAELESQLAEWMKQGNMPTIVPPGTTGVRSLKPKGCVFAAGGDVAQGHAYWIVRLLDSDMGLYEVMPNSTAAKAHERRMETFFPNPIVTSGHKWYLHVPEYASMLEISERDYQRIRQYLQTTAYPGDVA